MHVFPVGHVRRSVVVGATLVLIAGLLVFDVYTPLGVASHVLYIAPVLLALGSPFPRFAILVAAIATVLSIVGAFYSPIVYDMPMWIAFSNRIFGIVVIWVPVLFFLQHCRAQEVQRRLHDELEQRVRDRTREIAAVNQALLDEVNERMQTEQSLRHSQDALRASQEQLRSLTACLMTAQDEERRRISRELHDDINQRLALLSIDIRNLEKRSGASPEQLRSGLRSAEERLASISDDVRSMAYRFHPSILDDLGLTAALQRLVDDWSARTGIAASFFHHNVPDPTPRTISSCLYRIAQESLLNIARHARASVVEVRLSEEDNGIALSVRDSGIGFDPSELTHSPHGLGLLNMRERVRLVNGTMEIESSPGLGTAIEIYVPLTNTHDEKTARSLGG